MPPRRTNTLAYKFAHFPQRAHLLSLSLMEGKYYFEGMVAIFICKHIFAPQLHFHPFLLSRSRQRDEWLGTVRIILKWQRIRALPLVDMKCNGHATSIPKQRQMLVRLMWSHFFLDSAHFPLLGKLNTSTAKRTVLFLLASNTHGPRLILSPSFPSSKRARKWRSPVALPHKCGELLIFFLSLSNTSSSSICPTMKASVLV